jgi:hypothetical protein
MDEADPDDGPLAAVVACGLQPDQLGAYASMFVLYVLSGAAAGGLVLQPAPAGPVLDFPPQNVAAVVIAGPAQLAPAQAWAKAVGLDVAIVTHGPHMPRLLAVMARRIMRSARLAGDLSLRLATLRAVHENLQNAYDGLRAFVQQRALALPAVGFLALPDPDPVLLDSKALTALQYIPCEFRSLCGIGLHLPAAPARGAEGTLEVEVFSPENPAQRVAWQVAYRALPAGWVNFVFENDGAAVPTGATLRLRFHTLAAPAPRFSLARPHLRPDRAALVDGARLGRPLAFRAWINVPGAPLTLTAQLWPAFYPAAAAVRAQPATRIEILATDDFEVEDVRRLHEEFDFHPVKKIPRQRRILVHPLGRLPTVGRIPLACPAGTREIRAEVETDNEKAADLEYGIALAAEPLPVAEGKRPGDFVFSGPSDWVVVPAKTPGALVIELDTPLATPSDLYLIARCPPGSTSDLGWAHFTRLTVIGDFAAAPAPAPA